MAKMDKDMAGKDQLVSLGKNQTNPYDAKGSDWKVKVPAEGSGEEGMDQLLKQSETQTGPRHTEDDGQGKGYGTPVPTDRSAKVSANFKVSGNSNEGGSALGYSVGVDFGDGKHSSPDQKK